MSVQSVLANFPAGQSLSLPVPLSGVLVGIGVPASWTSAPLSFQASSDGGQTWVEVLREGNNYVLPVQAPSYSLENKNYWGGVTYLIVRSGTVNSPVTQPIGVSITLSIWTGS